MLQGATRRNEVGKPVCVVHIDVKDTSGQVEQWALETLATLTKGGLRSDMLGKGNSVTVGAYRLKNESKLAFPRKIMFADGCEIVVWVAISDSEEERKTLDHEESRRFACTWVRGCGHVGSAELRHEYNRDGGTNFSKTTPCGGPTVGGSQDSGSRGRGNRAPLTHARGLFRLVPAPPC